MDKVSVQKILDLLKEIKGAGRYYDLHVHPFEMMYAPIRYRTSSTDSGLFSAGSSEYLSPEINDLNLQEGMDISGGMNDKKLRAKVVVLNSRRIYAHTGPKVLGDQMELGAIDRALLLPIMGNKVAADDQLSSMKEMFGDDGRFMFGYSLPGDIPNDGIADEVKRAATEYGVKALKIHPAVMGLDLSGNKAKDRVESILDASKKAGLKVIIHGGKSPDCANGQAVSYGTVENLQHIDWSLTPETVVIAHCGCFGHSRSEVREDVLPIMDRLLGRYSHLAVDTSGIGFEALCQVMKNIDSQRIVFGSDALYEKQWVAIVKLWSVLEQTVSNPEEELLRIASRNPAGFFDAESVGVPGVHGRDATVC
jgi:predicted TIM-barrel fold metal-dependent hydrolase